MNSLSKYIPMLYYLVPMVIATVIITIVLSSIGKAEWWQHESFGESELNRVEGGSVYCETKHFDQYLIEDANALSNLGFIFLGEVICSIYFYDIFHDGQTDENAQNIMIEYPVWTLIYGLTMIYVGIASYLFHGALTYNTLTMDVAAIYSPLLLFYFVIFMNYINFIGIKHIECIGNNIKNNLKTINYVNVFLLLILDIICIIYRDALWPLPVIGTFIYISLPLILILEIVYFIICWKYLKQNHGKMCIILLIIGAILLFGGFGIMGLDATICSPDSFFQIHALFHVILSVGLIVLYFMLRLKTLIVKEVNDNKTTSNDQELVDMKV